MAKKILRRKEKINKDKVLMLEKNTEIFNTNKKIILKYIEMSSTGVINVAPELLETGMFAS